RTSCWQDVVDAIEKAKNVDKEKASNSRVRGYLRKSKVEISMLESLTSVIPDQNGLSILRCGLATIFSMVTVRLQLRETILDALEDIPDTFFQALNALSRFPDAPDILLAVRELYSSLLFQVDTLIRVLLRSHPQKNRMKRLWSQLPAKETEVVHLALQEVARAAARVSQCSQAALERTVANIDRKMDRFGDTIMSAIGQVRIQEREIQSDLESVVRTAIQDTLDKWRPSLSESQPPVLYILEASPQTPSVSFPWHNSSISPVSTSPGPILSSYSTPQKPVPLPTSPSPSPTASPNRALPSMFPLTPTKTVPPASSSDLMLARFGVSGGLSEDVLDDVTQQSSRLRPDAISRGMYLLSTDRFLRWTQAPRWFSDMILVDGHCTDAVVDKVSPMTTVCAHVVTALRENPSAIVLYHFCGQHTSFLDPLRGTCGLVRNLVHQLCQHALHLNLSGHMADTIDEYNLPALCDLFSEVIKQLDPSQPVFCIVDGVSELETVLDGWWDDLCDFVECLLEHVNTAPEHRKGPALRVMLTSMERAIRLADDGVVPKDRTVSLIARRSDYAGFGTDL
ncbi:uncharacterized protein PODANS_5_10870, partial [Podospora anserina S mat+]